MPVQSQETKGKYTLVYVEYRNASCPHIPGVILTANLWGFIRHGLIKHWWAGSLRRGLHMLVCCWHITHHPRMKNLDCRSAVPWLHMNVGAVGSRLPREFAASWFIIKGTWKEVIGALSHNLISCDTKINSGIELSMFVYFSMLNFNFPIF